MANTTTDLVELNFSGANPAAAHDRLEISTRDGIPSIFINSVWEDDDELESHTGSIRLTPAQWGELAKVAARLAKGNFDVEGVSWNHQESSIWDADVKRAEHDEKRFNALRQLYNLRSYDNPYYPGSRVGLMEELESEGLIESEAPDGYKRGWWKITPAGARYFENLK